MEYYRLDYIYSYWIFAWFLLYIIGIVQTPPIILIYFGLLGNLIELIYLIYKRASKYNLIKFILINTCLKVIPLYFIWNEKITNHEIKLTIIITFIYFLWLYINKINVQYFYGQFLNNYKTGKGPKTIVSEYYDRIVSKIIPI